MPKITVHGGPSNAAEPIPRPGEGVFFQEPAPPPAVDVELEAEPESTVVSETDDPEVAARLWPDGYHWDDELQKYVPGPATASAVMIGESTRDETEGGEPPSPGSSSSTSSPRTAKSSESSATPRPRPARTTGNRSK